MRWNKTIGSRNKSSGTFFGVSQLYTKYQWTYLTLGNMSCNDLSARPGFVIARYDLTELLKFHEIRVLIDLQHTNSQGMTLLLYALMYSDLSTVDRLIKLNPNQVRPSKGQNTLQAAVQRGFAGVVEKLLNEGEDVNVRFWYERFALHLTVLGLPADFGANKKESETQAQLNTARILLQRGVNIFAMDHDGLSATHLVKWSNTPALYRLFIEHVNHLEESGLIGSVQRLLRARDNRGNTPIDHARPPHDKYLQDELFAAVIRFLARKFVCQSLSRSCQRIQSLDQAQTQGARRAVRSQPTAINVGKK